MRLDLFILQKFNLKSRSFAENIIKKGKVTVNSVTVKKPSTDVCDSDEVSCDTSGEFESLGGDKLEKAISKFNISLVGKTCVDIGASNGGFTDCMLRHDASCVYAVDVGECALSPVLRYDDRVKIRDRLNARDITANDVDGLKDFLTIDVSFISLKLVLESCFALLKEDGEAVVLIKPQFETGKKLGKSGIVVNPEDRTKAINDVLGFAYAHGIFATAITTVPDNFRNKNIEYLVHFVKRPDGKRIIRAVDSDFVKNL